MSDSRLGINVDVAGAEAAAAKLKSLQNELRNVANLQRDLAGVGTSYAEAGLAALAKQEAAIKAEIAALGGVAAAQSDVASTTKIATAAINEQAEAVFRLTFAEAAHKETIKEAIALQTGLAIATANHAERQRDLNTAFDAVPASSFGKGISTETIQQAIRDNIELARTEENRAAKQRDLENTFRYGATSSSSAVGASVSRSNEAQVERLRQEQIRAAGASAVAWKTASAETINDMLGIGRSAGVTEAEVNAAFRRMGRSAANAGEEAGKGFWVRFLRGGRTPISLIDEGMRGQRGAMMATFGAGLKSANVGGMGLAAGMGGIVALVGTGAIIHAAEQVGQLNEEIQTGAEITGMSIHQYAQLQGALILVGEKATAADAMLKHFAGSVEKARADPNSESAKAFKAADIFPDELKAKGDDTFAMLQRVSQALGQFQNNSTKADFLAEVLGRSDSAAVRLIEYFNELTSKAQGYASAVDSNVEAGKRLAEEVNELGLSWHTFEENAIPALNVVLNTINGLIGAVHGLFAQLSQPVVISVRTRLLQEQHEEDPSASKPIESWLSRRIPPSDSVRTRLLREGQTGQTESGGKPIVGGLGGGAVEPASGLGQYGVPDKIMKPFSGGATVSAMESIQNEILKAENAALQGGGTTKQLHARENTAAARVYSQHVHDQNLSLKEQLEIQDKLLEVQNRTALGGATPKSSNAHPMYKEQEDDIERLRQKLAQLRAEHQLFNEQQDAGFEHERIQSRLQQSDKNLSPVQRAQSDYSAAQQSGAAKIADVQKLASETATIYAAMASDAKKQYDEDAEAFASATGNKIEIQNKLTAAQKEYDKILGEGTRAQTEYQVQIQKIQNQVDQQAIQIVEAHQQAVDQVVNKWGSAFDQIGDKLEDTIQEAIKSAFIPQKPEYWWSSSTGPGGIPLMQAHRINPVEQMFSGLGFGALGDLGKTFSSSITESISKSIFGQGTSSFGQGLAKMIGIGGPGGLFGTGLGAVASAGKEISQTTLLTTANTFLSTIAVNTGSTAAEVAAISASSGTSAATGAIGAAGSAGGFLSGIPVIGGFLSSIFGGGGGMAGLTEVLSTGGLVKGMASGGIVRAAAGMLTPRTFGTDSVLSALTPGERVLNPNDTAKLDRFLNAGPQQAGGDMHLHFHGPADAPSIQRWFKNMMAQNPGVVRDFFRQNALSPRTF